MATDEEVAVVTNVIAYTIQATITGEYGTPTLECSDKDIELYRFTAIRAINALDELRKASIAASNVFDAVSDIQKTNEMRQNAKPPTW